MKFTVENKVFKELVRQAAAQVASKPERPILSQALLTALPGDLYIRASNGDMTYRASCPAAVGENGMFTLSVAELPPYLASLGDCILEFSTSGTQISLRRGFIDGTTGEFCAEGGETLFDQYEVSDFPEDNFAASPGNSIAVSAPGLKAAIEATAFAADKEAVRPGLECVRFSVVNGALRLGAASNASLAIMDVSLDYENGELFNNQAFLLTAASCSQLASLLPEDEDILVEIGPNFNHSFVYFRYARTTVGISVFAVPAINFERMIEPVKHNPARLVLNRVELVKILRRVLVFTKEQTNRVMIMTIEPKEPGVGEPPSMTADVTIYGRTEQRFETEEVLRAVSYNGERIEIGLHISKMLEVLARFDGQFVEILLAEGTKPVLIRSVLNPESQMTVLLPLIFSKRPEKTSTRQSVAA